ncbi:MAG: fumarylacetoacetate hydrolase family protein [Ignavibacteria bacterium]|nr:fumarylacetoacetate hydrolase family protein [Ignavibacteria bacterium]
MQTVKIKGSEKTYSIGKVLCVGKNYLEHAKELGDAVPDKPVIFMKPASSIIFSGEKISHPKFSTSLHFETELVLIVGKTCKEVSKSQAMDFIAGYSVGLDMTLRDIQSQLKKNGHPWEMSKCFDTSTVLGEFVSTAEIDDPNNLSIKLWVNNVMRQNDNTSSMIYNVESIFEYLSTYFTLEEGDIIFTGTPPGVGEVKIGDKLKAEIESVSTIFTEIA